VLDDLLLPPGAKSKTRPIWLVGEATSERDLQTLGEAQRQWLESSGWRPEAGSVGLLPDEDGAVGGAVLGLGRSDGAEGAAMLAGALPGKLPKGSYHFVNQWKDPELAATAWALGSYRFGDYKAKPKNANARLKLPGSASADTVKRVAKAVYLGRDLINCPASDMGPAELERAARKLAKEHGAVVKVTSGDALAKNFPMIHAVGRASTRKARLIDFSWGKKNAPKVSLVGKGICFDTGGLNLKPGDSMALMKKDMGGAAAVLALASMIMDAKLNVRLRVLIPAAENSVSGDAYRPGDVLESRKGLSVEIGNTDAEGRLVLADALALADEEKPDILISMATLTGAARVALGPDLPPLYCDDESIAADLLAGAARVGDPLWRMPFWQPYDKLLKSDVADVNHISDGPFAGSITAALFLKRFVENAPAYLHFDIFGWVPRDKPGQPKGGEPQGARALYEFFRKAYG
jgi:leucyl aminopeptidase